MAENTENRVNRREFVATSTVVAVGLCVASQGLPALAAPDTAPSAGIDVGAMSDFTKDGMTMTWVHAHHVIVARESGKLYAMSSKCTHRNCDLTDATDHLTRNCHGSMFGYDGAVTNGPARRALARYAIALNGDGHLIVDTTQKFDDKHWDDPKSFVTVPSAT
jgi:nitrite reductase/ring-hydroxylating ferredoxin subunit